jgi:hypothetical protein
MLLSSQKNSSDRESNRTTRKCDLACVTFHHEMRYVPVP